MGMPSVRSLGVAVLVLIALAQFVRPARTNPTIDPSRTLTASAHVPADVTAIFDRSCRDCHSYETRWPWYSEVAPVSWLLVSHVNEGRRHLSLSTWADYDAQKAGKHLEEICEEVRDRAMPMSSYVLMHRSAALSDADRAAVCAWTDGERQRLAAGTLSRNR